MSLSKEKNYLLYLLAKQDYSRKQLFDKLISRGNISLNEINSLLDEFEQNKWLSDERFADVFINSEIAKFRGKKRIINTAVYQKGLSLELVESCLDSQELDWVELCKQCLNKKYRDINKLQADFKLKQKAMNYLIYNGFSFDEINFALNQS
ncbi:RecX family transcriptional regulator [Francisella tularensis subsp. novicida]|uniref:regulatory protein RecX n=1 Tax=Francisella tularensis TaxID=263 RepID=UPI000CE2951D|nr:regulatory protein RecX [Francisella tularensis]AVC43366.1 RecX family transcriptional regulator [Francisella tularensis subsp. novicida]